jgi:hypothetical protein
MECIQAVGRGVFRHHEGMVLICFDYVELKGLDLIELNLICTILIKTMKN